MQPRRKIGLIIGAIGLVLSICNTMFFGFGPAALSLIAGSVAGYLTAKQEKISTKGESARAGATVGELPRH